jgi:hypothetical protein
MNQDTDSSLPDPFEGRRAALVAGHPGHELRVLGWLRACQPAVAVLTDGSGAGESGRIGLTSELLDAAGCRRSPVYGEFTDRQVYEAILAGDAGFFLAVAARLAEWLAREQVELVASDSVEGYNPTHDLCAAVAGRAVRLASQASGRPIQHFTFSLVGPPMLSNPPPAAVGLSLEPPALADKLSEARRYAALAGGALGGEVDAMIREFGEDGFSREYFIPATLPEDFAAFDSAAPFYETHGEKQVAAGRYAQVIRYRSHIEPLVAALAD